MKKQLLFQLVAFGMLAFLATRCGTQSDKTACDANYSNAGFSLLVEMVSVNTYKFTVCRNSAFSGTVFSVYGVPDEDYISTMTLADLNTRSRTGGEHLSDASEPGDSFGVTFNDDDNWFVIYEDQESGGSFTFSNTSEMIRGNFRR